MLSRVLSACRDLLPPGPVNRAAGRFLPALLLFIAIAGVLRAARAEEAQQGSAPSSGPSMTVNSYSAITTSIARHFESSCITFGGGYNRSKAISGDDLFSEPQIYVHYT